MAIEIVSKGAGRTFYLSAKTFGKLLHLAKQNGWEPEKAPSEWPESSWDTQVLLPYVGSYISGIISASEAKSLKSALIRASATGQFAVDGSLKLASEVLLQVAREGSFLVRHTADESFAKELVDRR